MDPDDTLKSPKGVYKIVEKLGEGGFGYVYLTDYTVKNDSKSEQVALKEISLRGMSEEECEKEVELMKKISESPTSPHVIKYLDSFMTSNHRNLYIAMSYCSSGDLSSKISANIRLGKEFDPEIVYDYINQIADGINELHVKHKIVHRDLKPGNVLIAWESGNEVLKISDFGLAKVIHSLNQNPNQNPIHTICGTWFYMAPEQYSGEYEFPVDIWAIGIIFYELCIVPKRLDKDEMDGIRKKVEDNQRVNLPSRYSAAVNFYLVLNIKSDHRCTVLALYDKSAQNKNRNNQSLAWRRYKNL